MNKKQISITLGLMCMILTVSIFIQIKTIWRANTTVSQSFTENGLRDEVLKWKEKYDNAYYELGKAEDELKEVRESASQDDATSLAKQEQIKENNILLGLTEVKGQGIKITLTDNKASSNDLMSMVNPSSRIVHNNDLLEIVNALKNADAEAISINGQRIVSTTAITCEGTVIKVNGQKISSPFEIKAIGSQALFSGSLTMPGGYLEIMENDGVLVDIEYLDEVAIEKYDGVISYKYVHNND